MITRTNELIWKNHLNCRALYAFFCFDDPQIPFKCFSSKRQKIKLKCHSERMARTNMSTFKFTNLHGLRFN